MSKYEILACNPSWMCVHPSPQFRNGGKTETPTHTSLQDCLLIVLRKFYTKKEKKKAQLLMDFSSYLGS